MTQTELIAKRLDGKIAVITGGTSGTDLATAQRFVAEGAYVFVNDRSQSEVDAAKMSQVFMVTSQISQILIGCTPR